MTVTFFDRLTLFKSSLQNVFSSEHAQTLSMDTVVAAVRRDYPNANFTRGEMEAALNKMQDENQIMVSDEQIFLI